MLKIAIVVVSDTCVKDPSSDRTGKTLLKAIDDSPIVGYTILKYVQDDKEDIQIILRKLISENYSAVFTAGGTGFSPRDVTPEAVKPLIEKDAPGFVAAMLRSSLEITPLAAIARPIAGVASKTLIITLPGSPKGALENFDAISSVLPHALKLINGVDSRTLHSSAQSLESSPHSHSHSHSHTHGHDHTHIHADHHSHSHGNPEAHAGPKFFGPAFRDRKSPFPLIPFDDAVSIVKENAPEPVPTKVSLDKTLGCVLSEDIFAPINVPSFRASIVDGYAINHIDFSTEEVQTLLVSNVFLASSELAALPTNSCARITTGAPIPHGATAVIPVENTEAVDIENGEEITVKIYAPNVVSGDNIREIGSDVKINSLVLPKNTVLSTLGGEIGVLASLGITNVPVYRKPKVGVLSTGDEVVDAGQKPSQSQIWDSNRPMLLANLRSWLSADDVVDLGIVRDNMEALIEKMRSALRCVDVLITTGGVSMGELDLLKPIITYLGGEIKFGRVLMKPGKPVTFSTLPNRKTMLSLPGNPVSCVVCLQLFGYPLLAKMMGRSEDDRNILSEWITVELAAEVKLDTRPEFQRGLVVQDDSGKWTWTTTGFQRSSYIQSMVRANALARLPPSSSGMKTLPKGTRVKALLLGANAIY